jgi:hypothetical protein
MFQVTSKLTTALAGVALASLPLVVGAQGTATPQQQSPARTTSQQNRSVAGQRGQFGARRRDGRQPHWRPHSRDRRCDDVWYASCDDSGHDRYTRTGGSDRRYNEADATHRNRNRDRS